ncbi:MAG: hypothetical protein M3150_07575, partial [Pseudomonadota bacterium]|nr:hypothetical protein [Pseudomonadota bacterium]
MHFNNTYRRLATRIALLGALLLAGCGGGGGDDGGAPPDGGTVPPPAIATVTLFAGALQPAGSRDGVGAAAQFDTPADVGMDTAGNVYVADTANNTIRKVARDGTVSTLAGAAGQARSADGPGASARFNGPRGVAVDAAGNVYVSDTGNGTLRRILPSGAVTTIAGVAGQLEIDDGGPGAARLRGPASIAIDAAGTIYFVEGLGIRRRAPDGTITTFAGNPGNTSGPTVEGNATQTRFYGPLLSVAVDGSGNVYVADSPLFSHVGPLGTIRKYDRQGQALPFGTDASGVLPVLFPADIAVDGAGNVYAASNGVRGTSSQISVSRSVQKIAPDGRTMTTVSGADEVRGIPRTVDGVISIARFMDPRGIAVGPDGRIAVVETSSSAVRLIDVQQGSVVTLAGGTGGGEVDGPVATARFNEPLGLASTADGVLYVADS